MTQLSLAPMEGVLDYQVRELLTAINPYEHCVTEFIRITNHVPPKKTFLRYCPELLNNGKTTSGTPVRIQLLGQHPNLIAESAVSAVELGSFGVDLNFGCPAKTVVGHHGGAYLLTQPELIYQIVLATKKALNDSIVSVKIRLGWDDKSRCVEIADAIEQAGANELIIHGRTKHDGYRADAIDWKTIGDISKRLSIPVIANGEINSSESATLCQAQAHTNRLMIGRAALTYPNLAQHIATGEPLLNWQAVVDLLTSYAQSTPHYEMEKPLYHSARIKQWLSYLKKGYAEASSLLSDLRRLTSQSELVQHLITYKNKI